MLNPLLLKALPYLLASGAVVGAYVSWRHQEREIGKRDLIISQSAHALDSLKHRGDSLAGAFRIDTLNFDHWHTKWDSTGLRLLTATIDSLRHLPVPAARIDTFRVEVPIRVLVTADSTIQACTKALGTCEERVGLANARAQQYQLEAQAFKKLQPSEFSTWAWRITALGLGFLGGRANR